MVIWYFKSKGHGKFWDDFASDGLDFDAADGNSYKDYYSNDFDLFSLDDVSYNELRDIMEAWNAHTSMLEPFIPTIIIIGNGTKSQNEIWYIPMVDCGAIYSFIL